MSWVLGLDTSNYTTSVAAWNRETNEMVQEKRPLSVKEGALGLRQSDAVFSHVAQLGILVKNILGQVGELSAVGVSTRPRNQDNSYMPCFLVGDLAADCLAAARNIPKLACSHQEGHIAAALYSAAAIERINQPLIAFHLSGGTTECVLVTPALHGGLTTEVLYKSSDLYAGQAVDRVGAQLGLPFPAGPALEQLARGSTAQYRPRPHFDEQGNPSLSGVENRCKTMQEDGEKPEDIAKFCLQWIAAAVVGMTAAVKKTYPQHPVIYAGGVMSNELIQQEIRDRFGGHFATPAFSADNAAGVAVLTGLQQQRSQGEKFAPING